MTSGSSSRPLAKSLFIAALVYVAFNALTLTRSPLLWLDEATLNDAARSCAESGTLRSSVFSDIETFRHGYYWQPPVQTVLSAAMYSVMGFGVWQTRALPLVFGAASALMFAVLLLRMRISEKVVWIATAAFALDPLYSYVMRSGRMDSICVFFVLGGCVMMLRARSSSKVTDSLMSGVLLGLAGMTHPIAVSSALCFVVSQGVFFRRRILHAFMMSAGAALPVAMWIGSAVVQGRWSVFNEQFLGHGADHIVSGSFFERLMSEVLRSAHDYVRTPVVAIGLASIVLLFVVIVITSAKGEGSSDLNTARTTDRLQDHTRGMYEVLVWFAATFLFNALLMSKEVGFYALYPAIAVHVMLAYVLEFFDGVPSMHCIIRLIGWGWVVVLFVAGLGSRTANALAQWQERDPQTLQAGVQRVIPAGSKVYGEGYLWYAAHEIGYDLIVDDHFTNTAHPGRRSGAVAQCDFIMLEKNRCGDEDLKSCSLVDSVAITAPHLADERRRDTLYSMFVFSTKDARRPVHGNSGNSSLRPH